MKSILKKFADWKVQRKAKAEKLERERIEYEKQSKLEAEEDLIVKTHKMTNAPCAINGMVNCSETCVHFENGDVYTICYIKKRFFYTTPPRCKLWAKK